MRAFLAFVTLACSGCAVRPPVHPWRLVQQNSADLLIPPDVRTAGLQQRRLTTGIEPGPHRCAAQDGPVTLKIRRNRASLTVDRARLLRQPSGWLGSWAAALEEEGCIAPGAGRELAIRVADSVPLEPRSSLHLLYSNELETGVLDLDEYSRLRLVSPIWRIPGVGLMAEGPYDILGHGYSLEVAGRSTDNLVGYETTIYAVQPRSARAGYTIAPLYVDRSIDGATGRSRTPIANALAFPDAAAFYRVFYKSWKTEFTAVVVAAATPAELAHRVAALQADGDFASCQVQSGRLCTAIPKDIGLTSLVSVTVNGAEIFVSRGATVLNAIRSAGIAEPHRTVQGLSILRPWGRRMIAVEFDPRDDAVLRLVLRGGESIAWR